MTEHDPEDRELAPEQEAEIRRLLADARHTEPTPDAVVARLDRVFADLAGEPARSADVVRLADRRRRAATMLMAAAASVAVVIGIGQVISSTSSGDESVSSVDAEAGSGPEEAPAEPGQAPGEGQREGGGDRDLATDRLPLTLRSQSFAPGVEELRLTARADGVTAEEQDEGHASDTGSLRYARGRVVCEPGAWGRGSYVAVLYDKAEGWVVLRRPQGDTQVADLFLCGSEVVVRSVTLPYP